MDAAGYTALMLAAQFADEATVAALLASDVRWDVDAAGADGKTALILAAEGGAAGSVAQLLQRGAALDATDSGGYTALAWAMEKHRGDVVEHLQCAGAAAHRPVPSQGIVAREALDPRAQHVVARQVLHVSATGRFGLV